MFQTSDYFSPPTKKKFCLLSSIFPCQFQLSTTQQIKCRTVFRVQKSLWRWHYSQKRILSCNQYSDCTVQANSDALLTSFIIINISVQLESEETDWSKCSGYQFCFSPCFESQPAILHNIGHCFNQTLHINAGTVPSYKPWICIFSSFLIHQSELSFHLILCNLQIS